jgi:hypothetical protein
MNILDENIPESQSTLLRSWRIAFRQVGQDVGRMGMKDDEIIPLLHGLERPTFFTLDGDFHERRLCHSEYCLVHLDIEEEMVAEYIRRVLRHHDLNTKAKRMGRVIRASSTGIAVWRIHEERETHIDWQ